MEKRGVGQKKLTFKDLLFTGIGLTIGAGVVATVGPAIAVTGRSAWLAYMVAIAVGMLTVIPMAFFAATFRVRGGNYTCIRNCLGDNIGGVYVCISILMGLNFSTFAIASGGYINGILPMVNARLVAAIVLIAFWLLNMAGLNVFVKVQSIMSYVLLAALLVFGF
ncbi:MAG: APC family permease, partial [bacterium]|nr:APC family permease [bacterium]